MSKRTGSGEESAEHSVKKMKNEDNRLTYNSVPTLKQMAAVKIAIALWYHHNLRNVGPSLGYDWQSSVPEDENLYKLPLSVLNCCRSLDLFPKIRDEVEKYCDVIKKQMENWIFYQHISIFFYYHKKQVVKYLNEIIWRSDGLIDYRKTAKHMLGSLNITGIEKYRIICTYCLEEEIGNVSYIPLNNEYRERVVFESLPLIYYWNCKIRGEMNKITRGNFESVESRMLGSFYADNESAIQYFFNFVSPLEKLDCAKKLIRRYEFQFQCLVLSQFNEFEQREIFVELAPYIIVNFAKELHYSEYALNTWIYVQEFITENQCIEMWIDLLRLTDYGVCKIAALVADFWRNTSENFKQCVLKYHNNLIIKNAITHSGDCFDENLEYFLEMLSDASVELKKWAIYCDSTFFCFHSGKMRDSNRSLMRKFIDVCLPDPNDVAEFKTRLLDTYTADEHCWDLCEDGSMEELDKFLALFLPNQNAIDDYKEKLFMSQSTIIHFVHVLKKMDLDLFKTSIQTILSRNENANRFMMKLITSNGALVKFHKWIFKGEFYHVKECVEILLTDENDKNTVKKMLLHVYRDETIINLFTKLDGNLCEEFLSFCLSNEENASQFKQNLPFHYIFQTMLNRTLLEHYDHGDCYDYEMKPAFDFIKLDAFLLWFFVTVENVKKYKIQQIYRFHRIDIFVKNYTLPTSDALRKLVRWFFDNDAEEMQKFELSNMLTKLV